MRTWCGPAQCRLVRHGKAPLVLPFCSLANTSTFQPRPGHNALPSAARTRHSTPDVSPSVSQSLSQSPSVSARPSHPEPTKPSRTVFPSPIVRWQKMESWPLPRAHVAPSCRSNVSSRLQWFDVRFSLSLSKRTIAFLSHFLPLSSPHLRCVEKLPLGLFFWAVLVEFRARTRGWPRLLASNTPQKVPSTNSSRPWTRRETPLRIYTTTKAHISQAILCKAFGGNIAPSRRPSRSSLCRATFQSASSKRRLARTRNISSGASYLHEKHQPPFESSSDPQGDVAALLSSRHTS